MRKLGFIFRYHFLPVGLGKRAIRSLKRQEERGLPGELYSLFSSSCPLKAKAAVSALELDHRALCARPSDLVGGRRDSGSGGKIVLSLWQGM